MANKNRRFKNKHRPGQKPQPTVRPPAMINPQVVESINLGYLNASPLVMPNWKVCQIILVGAGGIGAYMAQHIGRIMRVVYQNERGIHLTVCDPDVVKYENIGRQLFCDAEENEPKALCMIRRYGHAWGLNCTAYVGEYDESLVLNCDLTVIVGCVDNAAARRAIAATLEHNPERITTTSPATIWWLDMGNLKDTGRALIGCAADAEQCAGAFPELKDDRYPDGACITLPGPGLQSPGLLEDAPEDAPNSDMSCAQLAAANFQSLNINDAIAIQGADMLTRMLVTKDLRRFAYEGNLAAGTGVSKYNTPDEVAGVIRRKPDFVRKPLSAPSLKDRPTLDVEGLLDPAAEHLMLQLEELLNRQ